MLEGLVAWVLNTYIGEYVENLNTHQLTVGIFQGQVELENLPLKKDALKSLELPVEVKHGFIGKIQLQVPIRRLKSEHWIITLDKLLLVAGPLTDTEYDEVKEKKLEHERKKAQLSALEENWMRKRQLIQQSSAEERPESWWSYGTSLFTNIVENLQLHIRDIHLRYEDDISIPGHPFAYGVTISSISAQSADASWLPKFVSCYDGDLMNKIVEVQGFSMYWDVNATMVSTWSRADIEEFLLPSGESSSLDTSVKKHNYILEPVGAQAKMSRNRSSLPLRSAEKPRFNVDIMLDALPIRLSDAQFHGLATMVAELERHNRRKRFCHLRPHCEVTADVHRWWKFAIDCHLSVIQDRRMRCQWQFAVSRARDIVHYIDAYRSCLTAGSRYVTRAQKDFIDTFEESTSFDELKVLRGIVYDELLGAEQQSASAAHEHASAEEVSAAAKPPSAGGRWWLQSWFPDWSGWYGAQELTEEHSPATESLSVGTECEKALDEEILDVFSESAENSTVLRQDVIFAQFSFSLHNGTFSLLRSSQTLAVPSENDKSRRSADSCMVELECSSINVNVELRPRSGGFKIGLCVEDLYLRDKMTTGSVCPSLIEPVKKDALGYRLLPFCTASSSLTSCIGGLSSAAQFAEESDNMLFSLIYERKPLHVKADYKLIVNAKPLNITYNPAAIRQVLEYLSVLKSECRSYDVESRLASTARSRYESLKKHTQDELKHTIDAMLDTETKVRGKRWMFDFNICAPHITIPECFTDENSVMVVFDLGRLQFRNLSLNLMSSAAAEEKQSPDDDEEFVTPLSTPPSEAEDAAASDTARHSELGESVTSGLSASAIYDKIYETYLLSLSDLQVMVGRVRDNWKVSYHKGTSLLHVVDKFSISLQFDRRLVYTTDPRCPKVKLSGNVPSLVFHVSEQKVSALRSCARLLSSATSSDSSEQLKPRAAVGSDSSVPLSRLDKSMYYGGSRAMFGKSLLSLSEADARRSPLADSVLLMMNFGIDKMSLEIQSRGLSIAELQVGRVRAAFVQKPFETSVGFAVHSLLVVDALQMLGHDYELLVASHHGLCLDSCSGSIRDSKCNSPSSPACPSSPTESLTGGLLLSDTTSKTENVNSSFTHLLHSLPSPMSRDNQNAHSIDWPVFSLVDDDEALIKVNIDIIDLSHSVTEESDDTAFCQATIEFNSLDVIANQQTVVELIGFFQRAFPQSASVKSSEKRQTDESEPLIVEDVSKIRRELTANFHRLNVLLIRIEEKSSSPVARKVALATLSEAKIQANFDSCLSVEGSLSGLQLLNLTSEGHKHQHVLHVGCLPPLNSPQQHLSSSGLGHYCGIGDALGNNRTLSDAFTFKFMCGPQEELKTDAAVKATNAAENTVKLVLRMASVTYLHIPRMLHELALCVSDFRAYFMHITDSLRSAAADLAMGLVMNKRAELLSAVSMYGSSWGLDVGHFGSKSELFHQKLERECLASECDAVGDLQFTDEGSERVLDGAVAATSLNFLLDAVLDSPVVMLPRSASSVEVLSLHLGKIVIINKHDVESDQQLALQNMQNFSDVISVEILNMSMYSADVDKLQQQTDADYPLNYGTVMLYDTSVEMKLQRKRGYLDGTFAELYANLTDDQSVYSALNHLEVTGTVVTPLHIVLTKDHYEQILNTLDNILLPDDVEPCQSSSDVKQNGLGVTAVSDEVLPGVSALKCDELLSMQQPRLVDGSASVSVGRHDASLVVCGSFTLPSFIVLMRADFADGGVEKDIVALRLDGFEVNAVARKWIKAFDFQLQSLVMEDLLQDESSTHRCIMKSRGQPHDESRYDGSTAPVFLSQSCPTSIIDLPTLPMPPSLPSSLDRDLENVFQMASMTQQAKRNILMTGRSRNSRSTSEYPCAPPPSRCKSASSLVNDDLLVRIKLKLVDRNHPQFFSKYNSVNRFVEVNFNCLETTVNLETWVLVLEFIGIGGKFLNPELFTRLAQQARIEEMASGTNTSGHSGDGDVVNMEMKLSIASLSLVLNKQKYELARAEVSNVASDIVARDGNVAVTGQLGSMLLQDTSPHGSLYRERFVTTGSQAVVFDIFKYGTPDPDGMREYDVQIKLTMSSVRYVHTHRFMQETFAFVQNFNKLQDVLGRSRAVASGKKISDGVFHNARISLSIDAGAPVILIPHSSRTKDVLVMDLGKLNVTNAFIYDGQEGTLSHRYKSRMPSRSDFVPMSATATSCSSSTFDRDNIMNRSVYGSLDEDYRGSVSHEHSDEGGGSPSAILSSFYSALGVSAAASVSSCIVQPNGSTPCVSTSRMGTGTYHLPSATPARSDVCYSHINSNCLTDDADMYSCLLDVMHIELCDAEVYSACWTPRALGGSQSADGTDINCLVFQSFIIQRQRKVLRDKCWLHLQVERNLDGDISHAVPDFSIDGKLSSLHLSADPVQYQLARGLLEHNFGEPLEEFQSQLLPHFKDPRPQPTLNRELYVALSICLELAGVEVELVISHGNGASELPVSLARFDFQRSQLRFESRSDGSKDIDLVSHEITVSDTRYQGNPVNVRPNVFSDVLKPSPDRRDLTALQLELHSRTSRVLNQYKVILNSMRVIGVFDWLLATMEFLAVSLEDPFKKEREEMEQKDKRPTPSMYFSNRGSVLTRRIPGIEQRETQFELCLNIIDSELVVVESTADWDTNAVILKSTAVVTYRQSSDRPLSCSLQSLEVFSCSLAAEAETALSIIDPMSLSIELNSSPAEHERKLGTGTTGLLDVAIANERLPILEVSFQTLSVRLSYNDIRLFMAIINSMPQQLLNASPASQPKNATCIAWQVSKLQALGFSKSDCETALTVCQGQLDKSATWLTKNVRPVMATSSHSRLYISGFEVKDGSVSICLIDDCQDADVPLAELVFADIYILHKFYPQSQGCSYFRLIGDYYNRALSGWEPAIEKWGCKVRWNSDVQECGNKLSVEVEAFDRNSVLNVNVTSCLLEQWSQTSRKWAEDYQKMPTFGKDYSVLYNSRRRVPFIPFALRNETGCRLQFATVKRTLTRTQHSNFNSEGFWKTEGEWKVVEAGRELPFLLAEHDKIRHKHTHEPNVHQLIVKVDGWKQVQPVSVDKVGVYFRNAAADIDSTSKMFLDVPAARLIFEVTIEGSARKVITVRSALMLHNQLEDEIEVRLINQTRGSAEKSRTLSVPRSAQLPLPLQFVNSDMHIRPSNWSLHWCLAPVKWQVVTKAAEPYNCDFSCDMLGGPSNAYRFCVSVRRLKFPPDLSLKAGQSDLSSLLPGHIITIAPPLVLESLLPMDMHYRILQPNSVAIAGTVKPGKKACLVTVDLHEFIDLEVTLENFPICRSLAIPPETTDYKTKMYLQDVEKRILELIVTVKAGVGGSQRLSIAAAYWLVNKSGLPLIFKQDSCQTPAAGQFEEHEIARCVAPLLFCFADKEKYELCTMKLGKSVHGPGTTPQWCGRFTLEGGVTVRQVHVIANTMRPDWVYNIGIEVRQGRGQYCETNIVTFTPRYQLNNQSIHKLAYAQRHLASQHKSASNYLSALPNCVLPYHWPRVDLDTLLCVRMMDKSACRWSGGFQIDGVDSFHVNMREEGNRCLFLHVDIVLHGATYVIVFTDTDQMPPPYRVDNFAEVPVQFYQTKTSSDHLRTYVRPRTSVPYAWDEPTALPHITLKVQSGTCATYDMNTVGDGEKLYYENFIYIAFSHTFKSTHRGSSSTGLPGFKSFFESQELVLDVIDNRVVLKKKEPGKRSQLWRMSSTGMLQHEGSSAPQDPHKSMSSSAASLKFSSSVTYVLDIKDIALQPDREVPLTLRKPEERRRSTQIWQFKDGQLFCGETKLCVQSKGGSFGLYDGGEAVLGPALLQSLPRAVAVEVAPELAIARQKSQEGSGVLCVKVVTDGPTRVLQITDVTQQQLRGTSVDDWMIIDKKRSKPELAVEATESDPSIVAEPPVKPLNFEIVIRLNKGLGISLIDRTPEELVYIMFRDVAVEYVQENEEKTLRADVRSLQVDNQLFGSCKPVLLYVMPTSPQLESAADTKPALTLAVHRMPSRNWDANVFKHVVISLRPLALQVEEKLLWRLLQFCGFGQQEAELETTDEAHIGSQRALLSTTSTQFRRHYFGTIKINSMQVSLSVLTSSSLSPDLKAVKQSLRFPLIRFEDAKVELDAFIKLHLFETTDFLLESIRLHYTKELKSQAAKILGSVDFLGNPLGLFSDVAEGMSGLLELNIGGLLSNVTHGFSNTAAKLTGTLSDNVGMATLDKKHQQQRQQIMTTHLDGGQTHHFRAGLRSLMHGVVGGIASIPQQAIVGARDEGVVGLVSGVGKGVFGTVFKPVAGVLDFASGAASAIRDTSKSHIHRRPLRVRRPRCCYGHGGLLVPYSEHSAEAQEELLRLNGHNYAERFIALESLRAGDDELQVLISSQKLYFVGRNYDVVLLVPFDELLHCQYISRDGKYYIELTIAVNTPSPPVDIPKKRPEVRCDSESTAQTVLRNIVYAKNLYDEIKQTVPSEAMTCD